MRDKIRLLLTINALVGIAFGLALLLLPEFLLRFYGLTTDATGLLLARVAGVEFTGYGALGWILRNADPAPAESPARAIIRAHLISESVGTIVMAWGALSGLGNALLWTAVATYGVMALAFIWATAALRKLSTP